MYKVMSSYYGQMTSKVTLEEAIYWANGLKTKAHADESITVWFNGEKVYTAGEEIKVDEADEIEEMKKCFEREGLDVEWDNDDVPMFYPYIRNEAKDLRTAREIVKDFGYTLKLWVPGARDIDYDAQYQIIKKA